jgi:hypothetical protein
MKYCITIFVMPYEIGELKQTVSRLNLASKYLSKQTEWVIDIKLSVSDYLVDWDKSDLDIHFFQEELYGIIDTIDWATTKISTTTEILGCVSQRRESLLSNDDCDFFIWLDTDIVFDERTLAYMEMATTQINDEYVVITPEIVRIWDTTWDCLVNERYLTKPLNFHLECEPEMEVGIKGDISIVQVSNNIPNQPVFKFSGGWFTCISSALLKRVGIPKSLGQYGLEDTYIMWASQKLVINGLADIKQYKIKNLVVCENYKNRDYTQYTNKLTLFNRKEEFKKIAQDNISIELSKVK